MLGGKTFGGVAYGWKPRSASAVTSYLTKGLDASPAAHGARMHYKTVSSMSFDEPCWAADPAQPRRAIADGIRGEFDSFPMRTVHRSIAGQEAMPIPAL